MSHDRVRAAALRALVVGASASQQHVVEGDLVTSQPGSPVLGTPSMILLMELVSESVIADKLPRGLMTVGYSVDVRHLAPATEGTAVTLDSRLIGKPNGKLLFEVSCRDGKTVIGEGLHRRAIVALATTIDEV